MFHTRKGLALSIAATTLAVSSLTPAAFASNTTDDVDRTVQLYARQMDDSFTGQSDTAFGSERQGDLAAENGAELYDAADTGLKVDDAEVTTSVVSRTPIPNGYTVLADITTHLRQVPEGSNTIITLGSTQADHLDTSTTYRHELTLAPAPDGSSEPYQVVSDKTLLDDDSRTGQTPHDGETTTSAYRQSTATGRRHMAYAASFKNKAGLDWLKAVQYAELWTDSKHVYKNSNMDFMNPKYPVFEDNCTNFVSQALFEGGLPAKKATIVSRTHDDVWAYMAFAQFEPTYTWGGAENNYRYMRYHSGAFDADDNIKHIGPGGLIYADWDGNGSKDHAVIVTGNITIRDKSGRPVDSRPIICQKTHNQHDAPITVLEKYAQNNYHGKTKWYGLQFRF